MKVSLLGKRTLSFVLHSSGFLSGRLKDGAGGGLLILMYHRVVDGIVARALGQDGMYVDAETFENHLRFVKRHFHVVSLSETLNLLERRSGNNVPGDRPLCAITFDDGWRDVYENAYPLLRSHGLPATVFLPTGFIGTRKQFWTDRLARLISTGDPGKGKCGVRTTVGSILRKQGVPGIADDMNLHGIIEAMKRLRHEEIETILCALAEEGGVYPAWEERVFLNWEEVAEMLRSGLVRFGSHTVSHRILTTLSDDEVALELRCSKEHLIAAGMVDPAFIPFAYPNGNHTDRIAAMVRSAGYRLAVTTEKGWNLTKLVPDAYRLKRIGVHQDIASTDAMFYCRLAEIF